MQKTSSALTASTSAEYRSRQQFLAVSDLWSIMSIPLYNVLPTELLVGERINLVGMKNKSVVFIHVEACRWKYGPCESPGPCKRCDEAILEDQQRVALNLLGSITHVRTLVDAQLPSTWILEKKNKYLPSADPVNSSTYVLKYFYVLDQVLTGISLNRLLVKLLSEKCPCTLRNLSSY